MAGGYYLFGVILMNIGKAKAIFDRQRNYFSTFNFVMIAVLFFKETKWSWYYLLAIPAWMVWTFIDTKYIMPKEFEYLHRKSPVMKELLRK